MRLLPLLCAGCYAIVELEEDEEVGPPIAFTDGVPPSNLLILSVDTTRRDHIGRFSGNGLTPNLDAFLAEAVVLSDHRSCSNWTAPSMTCVASGKTQMEQGFANWNSNPFIPTAPGPEYEADTLATLMKGSGRQTLLITANSVFGPWNTGIGVGYDEAINLDYQQAAAVADTTMLEIGELQATGSPWYAHVHFMDPHGPYCAPDSYVDMGRVTGSGISLPDWCADSYGPGGAWYAMDTNGRADLEDAYLALYEAEMKYWDTEFGAFWDELEASGALDDTLVVFVTDHGQQFFERGGHGHGIYLGAEENRGAAAFWARDLPPREWTEPTIHQDVNVTLLDVFGLVPIEPRSGYVLGQAPDRSIDVINYWGGTIELAVIRDQQQLNYNFDGARAFYDYETDPRALTDTYNAKDPDVIALWADMDRWIDRVLQEWPNLSPPVDPGP